jgi:hypothetical protein
MADVLEQIQQSTEEMYDGYVRTCPEARLIEDLEAERVVGHQVALALVRQRARLREELHDLAARVDGLEQLLAMFAERAA